jgi:hypothetical protein
MSNRINGSSPTAEHQAVIDSLVRETRADPEVVRQTFENALAQLKADARVPQFLVLIAARKTKEALKTKRIERTSKRSERPPTASVSRGSGEARRESGESSKRTAGQKLGAALEYLGESLCTHPSSRFKPSRSSLLGEWLAGRRALSHRSPVFRGAGYRSWLTKPDLVRLARLAD